MEKYVKSVSIFISVLAFFCIYKVDPLADLGGGLLGLQLHPSKPTFVLIFYQKRSFLAILGSLSTSNSGQK